jgi:hypothetical protein
VLPQLAAWVGVADNANIAAASTCFQVMFNPIVPIRCSEADDISKRAANATAA